ncbi:MAG: hypothetical protein CL760_11535 [Chloroflexi bacterium]|nr:hypothetical protein [Chloroflexota bacterium]|tara:strand:+ start:1533 stop:1898 length:366 start_codon:yes stop_codon:yes gene_type:complete
MVTVAREKSDKITYFKTELGKGMVTKLHDDFKEKYRDKADIVDIRASTLHEYDIRGVLDENIQFAKDNSEKEILLAFDEIASESQIARIELFVNNIEIPDNLNIYVIQMCLPESNEKYFFG